MAAAAKPEEKFPDIDPPDIAEILAEFKTKTKCENDLEALRFLRARRHNVDAAVLKWTKSQKWRASLDLDATGLVEPKLYPLVNKLMPQAFSTFAKDGTPLYIGLWGKINYRAFITRIKPDEWIQSHCYIMENFVRVKCPEGAKLMNQPPRQNITSIIDMAGLSWEVRQFLGYFQMMSAIDTANYPETLGRTFVVNAPWMFGAVWNLVKSWLDPYTVSKVNIFTDVPTAELLKYIDASHLPVEYGGEAKGVLPPIPTQEELHAEDQVKLAEAKKRLKPVDGSVAASAKVTIDFPVDEKDFDSKTNPTGIVDVEYFFQTKSYDIKFAVDFTPVGAKAAENMLPLDTYKSHEVPVIGGVAVSKPGTLHLIFDNTYSWMTAKSLTYGVGKVAIEGLQKPTEEAAASEAAPAAASEAAPAAASDAAPAAASDAAPAAAQ